MMVLYGLNVGERQEPYELTRKTCGVLGRETRIAFPLGRDLGLEHIARQGLLGASRLSRGGALS